MGFPYLSSDRRRFALAAAEFGKFLEGAHVLPGAQGFLGGVIGFVIAKDDLAARELEIEWNVNEMLQGFAHAVLQVRFDEEQRTAPEVPCALSIEGSGHEWSVLCDGQTEKMRKAAEELGARVVEESTPTLEEIFVARARG